MTELLKEFKLIVKLPGNCNILSWFTVLQEELNQDSDKFLWK